MLTCPLLAKMLPRAEILLQGLTPLPLPPPQGLPGLVKNPGRSGRAGLHGPSLSGKHKVVLSLAWNVTCGVEHAEQLALDRLSPLTSRLSGATVLRLPHPAPDLGPIQKTLG